MLLKKLHDCRGNDALCHRVDLCRATDDENAHLTLLLVDQMYSTWLIKCHQISSKNCPRARSLKLHESDICNVKKSSSERYSSMTSANFIPRSEPVWLKWQNHTKSTLPNKPFQIQYSAHHRAPYYSNIYIYIYQNITRQTLNIRHPHQGLAGHWSLCFEVSLMLHSHATSGSSG